MPPDPRPFPRTSTCAIPPADSSSMPHANADIDTFTPENISFVEIFPPIGIARVGNSGTIAGQRRDGLAVEYFLGPEVPLGTAQPAHGFRDKGGRIKRQVRAQA